MTDTSQALEFQLVENQGQSPSWDDLEQDFDDAEAAFLEALNAAEAETFLIDPDAYANVIKTMERAAEEIAAFGRGELPIG